MRSLRAWLLRFGGMFHRRRREAELSAELESHVQLHIEDAMRAGMTVEQARRDALIKLGGIEQIKERHRDQRGLPWLDHFIQDLRFGLRMLRKSPAFTAVAVATLGLGIGANTAIFTMMNGLMLRSLPVRDPGQLVELLHHYPGEPEPGFNGFSWDAYRIMRDGNHVFSDLFIGSTMNFAPVRADKLEPQTLFVGGVGGTFFQGLGVQPAAGRLIDPEDVHMGYHSPVAVISWSFWKSRFDLDPGIIGKKIVVGDDTPLTIIGVTQRGFYGLSDDAPQDIWFPVTLGPGWGPPMLGRLKPGVSIEQARAEMAGLFERVVNAPDADPFVRGMKLRIEPAGKGITTPLTQMLSTPLKVLMATVGLLLLLACANLAGLLFARGASRQHEMAVRACLGAARARLLRQTLTESLMLSLIGCAVGIFLAYFAAHALVRVFASGRFMVGAPVHFEALTNPDAHVLWFTAAIALLTGLLCGVAPAMSASNAAPAFALQQTSRIGESKSGRLFGKSLIVAQVAVSTVLLSLAALFVGYVSHLRSADLGFRRDHLLLLQLDPSHSGYDDAQLARLFQELLGQLKALPGVRSATLSDMTPMLGAGASSFVTIKGHPEVHHEVSINYVAPQYFESYGTPLLAGREVSFKDEQGPLVAVINDAVARDCFGSKDPIGSYITLEHVTGRGNDTPTYQVVGVVGDAKYNDLQQPAPRTIYLHGFQEGRVVTQLTVRTAVNPESVTNAVGERVASVLKTVPIVRTTTMTAQIDAAIVPERLTASLSSCFGALGALLAAIGLYGLLAYAVQRRTNEIGVRMALGAGKGDVMRMVFAEALGIVVAGVLLGVPLAFWGRKIAASLIEGLPAKDPLPVLVGSLGILVITFVAVYWPARRAAKVDPIVALRYE